MASFPTANEIEISRLRAALAEAERKSKWERLDELNAAIEATETTCFNGHKFKHYAASCPTCAAAVESRLAAAVEVLREVDRYTGHVGSCNWAAPDCSCGYLSLRSRIRSVLAGEP